MSSVYPEESSTDLEESESASYHQYQQDESSKCNEILSSPHIGTKSDVYHQAASCVCESENQVQEKNPQVNNRIVLTFRSPDDDAEFFSMPFNPCDIVYGVKNHLAKILHTTPENFTLFHNKSHMKDSLSLSEVICDAFGNIDVDLHLKDTSNTKMLYVPREQLEDITITMKDKPIADMLTMAYIIVKFYVVLQKRTFTCTYQSSILVQEVLNNLAELLRCEKDNIVLRKNDVDLKSFIKLSDLQRDEFGNLDLELVTKNKMPLDMDVVYSGVQYGDILTVAIPSGDHIKEVTVEILDRRIEKQYLGGYRHLKTGVEYHHAYTQTPQREGKTRPEMKYHRDTQTAVEKEKVFDTPQNKHTQMSSSSFYVPDTCDRVLLAGTYETHEQVCARLRLQEHAAIIQRAYRAHRWRQRIKKWLAWCNEILAKLAQEKLDEKNAHERRLKKDMISKTFPRTREDFDQLYAMVDRWKNSEITRINQLHSKGPRIAEFSLLLDKEVELLRSIESYRIKLREDHKLLKEKRFLEEISKPVVWFGPKDKVISMDTVEAQRARKFKDLYNAFCREDVTTEQRMELLVSMKYALKEFLHPLTTEIITLLDRECDLMIRNYGDADLQFLRRRIQDLILQLIKTSELNLGVTRRKTARAMKDMSDGKLHLCEMCKKCKHYSDFPLHAKVQGFMVCTSCSVNANEKSWVDMTPYKFILRTVRQDERKRRCWGSAAFVLQEKDIFFIIEKLWHSKSAISECSDMFELRLCRWYRNMDWSPWNCLLVTSQEMKSHLQLDNPDEVYDSEFVVGIKNKHMLARAHFDQMVVVDTNFVEHGGWHKVHAGATHYINGVEPM